MQQNEVYEFTVYEIATGELGARFRTNEADNIQYQIEPGVQSIVEGHWDASTHRVVGGVVVAREME